MRVFRLAGSTLAAVALLATPATARTVVHISGIASPPILAFTTTPQPLSLSVDVRLRSDVPGHEPGTIKKAVVYFPHGPRVNGALFPSCNPATLRAHRGSTRACPRGSRIGSGTALGTSPQFPDIDERLKVEVYNGPRGRSVVFWIHGDNPVSIAGMIDAPLQAIHSHRWAYRLTLDVPSNLQKLGTGIFASLLRFTTKVGGTELVHGRRRGYIEVLACPPGALVPISSRFSFLGGSTASASGYIACGGR